MSEQKTLREVVDFARCYDLGTVEGHAIADWIEAKFLDGSEPSQEVTQQAAKAWEYSFIHSSATGCGESEVGPCLTYDRAIAYGVGCIKQREVSIAPTTSTVSASGALAAADDVKIDSERWQFMMRIADNEEGPEAQAMDKFRQDTFESDRPKSIQLQEMVDAARAVFFTQSAAQAATDKSED